MSKEQPSLFGEVHEMKPSDSWLLTKDEHKIINEQTFLPGVKKAESYPQTNNHDDLCRLAVACNRCRLRSSCMQVVFCSGNIKSRIMLVGEGPGKDEDNQGLPFVGRAGQLLDRILEAAELKRSEVYVTNVVKCRPPENRLPNPDEVKACAGFLEAQIRIIKPGLIICLGALASQVIIDPRSKISQVRGKWFIRQDKKIMATFHPAALLRNEAYKRPTWEDFKLIRDEFKGMR